MKLSLTFSLIGLLVIITKVHSSAKMVELQREQGLYDLKCEHLSEPIGIDVANPRFSWKISDFRYAITQSAYRIKVTLVSAGQSLDFWDSGIVDSDKNTVEYDGEALKSQQLYEWSLEVWDNHGLSYPIKKTRFETAMMNESDWQGHWISDTRSADYRIASQFRKSFNVDKQITRATLYIASAGLHHLTINGEDASDEFLNPMYTKFSSRLLYNTYDVTNFLEEDENVIGVILGNGWYNFQLKSIWDLDKAEWRDRPAFLANLKVWFEDGSDTTFITDQSWKTTDSPITFNHIFLSEGYDFSREIEGWDQLDFDDRVWSQVSLRESPTKKLHSQLMPPVRATERFAANRMVKLSDRNYIYFFPKNIAGITELSAQGTAGTELKIIHGEQTIGDQQINNSMFNHVWTPSNPNEEFQTDIITIGSTPFVYRPKFNYKGFQYVQIISSNPIELNQSDLVAIRINSDMDQIGQFESSNVLINKIWEASNNSYLSNMVGYPTDCPQREKSGWTGDAHVMAETGLFNFDSRMIYEKWLRDHQDAQRNDGSLPNIIPTASWSYNAPSIDWTSSIIIIPWELYQMTGETKILKENYAAMKRFMEHWDGRSLDGLINFTFFGDWTPAKTISRHPFLASAYYFKSLDLLSNIAFVLGEFSDFEKYRSKATLSKKAINLAYINEQSSSYQIRTQTELSMAIDFGIVEGTKTAELSRQLSNIVKGNNNFLDVGLLGSKSLLDALASTGHTDQALSIVKKTEEPSWGYWINQGLTAFPEGWSYKNGQPWNHSMNHAFLGEVNAWFFKGIGGIYVDPDNPGFKNVVLKPNFDSDLGSVVVSHDSPFGQIKSEIIPEDDSFIYRIEIPANSTGELTLPSDFFINDFIDDQIDYHLIPKQNAKGDILLGSGSYEFRISRHQVDLYDFPMEQIETSDVNGSLLIDRGGLFFQRGSEREIQAELSIFDMTGRLLRHRIFSIDNDLMLLYDLSDLYYTNITNIVLDVMMRDGTTKRLNKRVRAVERK